MKVEGGKSVNVVRHGRYDKLYASTLNIMCIVVTMQLFIQCCTISVKVKYASTSSMCILMDCRLGRVSSETLKKAELEKWLNLPISSSSAQTWAHGIHSGDVWDGRFVALVV
jgi:hypothetical protein